LYAQSFMSILSSVGPNIVKSNHPLVSDLSVAELFLQAS
jgi:hypothetical protein